MKSAKKWAGIDTGTKPKKKKKSPVPGDTESLSPSAKAHIASTINEEEETEEERKKRLGKLAVANLAKYTTRRGSYLAAQRVRNVRS